MMKGFKKFVEEKKISEAVDQKVVIHTKNGKVSRIEQGTYMPNGVFIGNAGASFDKGFIGMDPEDAKASLIKWSKFSPDKIIIEDAASRVKAAQEFEAKTGISPEDFEAYEDVRQSGVTNMFDVRTVMELSGLSRDMVMKIMKNYSEAKKVYGE